MTIVLDASIALDWCFESERSAYAETVLDHVEAAGAIVPAIWPAEVANGLLSAERRGRVTAAEMAKPWPCCPSWKSRCWRRGGCQLREPCSRPASGSR